jgi:hypothetical protein
MCCKVFHSVHRILVGFVHCWFSSLCASILFTVLVSVNYVVTSDHRLISLFQSVNICYVFCVAGTRYSPCSLCRSRVVSVLVVCFVLFISVVFICLGVQSVFGWKASGVTSRKGVGFVGRRVVGGGLGNSMADGV